jgi:exportin-2 (importin alpha re-exporter)
MRQDVDPLPGQDKALIRSQLVPAMLALSSPSDRPVRAQVSASVSLIAGVDFPERWPDLIDVSIESFNPNPVD